MHKQTESASSSTSAGLRSPWLNATDAASHLRVGIGTIRNLTYTGKIPACKRGGIVR